MTINFQGSEVEGAAKAKNGPSAHAEGNLTVASGPNSHAEGVGTQASSGAAHAEGGSTFAYGSSSHAEGNSTTAGASAAHAEGYNTTATGPYSHAEGSTTNATAIATYAGGQNATADANSMWARGSVNPGSISATRAQAGIYTLAALSIASGSPVVLTADGSAATFLVPGANVIVVPVKSVYTFTYLISGKRYGTTGFSQSFSGSGAVYNDSGTPVIMGTPNASAWNGGTSLGTFAVTTNASGALLFQVTPSVAASIGWHAVVQTSELTMSA